MGWWCLKVQAGLEFRELLASLTLVLGQGVCATTVHLARIPFFFFSEFLLNTGMFSFQIVVTQDDIPFGRIKLFLKKNLGLYGKAGFNPGCESTLPPCAAS